VLDSWDDDQLLAALGDAVRARQAVPDTFVEMGKGAYAWHRIDAELAQLIYDSGTVRIAAVRSETASVRALSFASAHLSMELEITEDCLLGWVIPSGTGTLEAQTGAGASTETTVDEIGCFAVDPIPASPFRLRFRGADGTEVLTVWVTL
jgi:hypothetical protein